MKLAPLRILLITVLAPILNGCISHYQLRNLGDKPHASLNAASINGIYVNISTNQSDSYSLWSKLKRCASNKGDTLRVPEEARVKLEFDGDRKLKASLLKDTVTLRQITIQVHHDDSCVWTRRKLFLIPVPLLFYVYNEDRAMLFNPSENELTLNYKANSFAMTLGAAGSSNIKESSRYLKLKPLK